MSVICILKDDYSNAFTLTLSLFPAGLNIYSKVDWISVFNGLDLHITPVNGDYDQESNRLRIRFNYYEDL